VGVTTNNGNILRDDNQRQSGAEPIADAGTGGGWGQPVRHSEPAPIIASSLAILSADRVSLGALVVRATEPESAPWQHRYTGESRVPQTQEPTMNSRRRQNLAGQFLNPVSGAHRPALVGSGDEQRQYDIGLRVTAGDRC
jgi:hypothetical protein